MYPYDFLSLLVLLFLQPTDGCYPAVKVSGLNSRCTTTDGPLVVAQFTKVNNFAVNPELPDILYVGTSGPVRSINRTSGLVTTVYPLFPDFVTWLSFGKRNFGVSFNNHVVFEFLTDGSVIKTCGVYGYSGSSIGNCTQTKLSYPSGLLVDPTESFAIIFDSSNNRTLRWNLTDYSMSILHITTTKTTNVCVNPFDDSKFFLLTQSYIYLASYNNSDLQLIAGNSSWGNFWTCIYKDGFFFFPDANDNNRHTTIRKMNSSPPYTVTDYLGYGTSCNLTAPNYIDAFIEWNGVAWLGSFTLCNLYNVYDPIWNMTSPQPYPVPTTDYCFQYGTGVVPTNSSCETSNKNSTGIWNHSKIYINADITVMNVVSQACQVVINGNVTVLGILQLENNNLTINGNLHLSSTSTLNLDLNTNDIHIGGCVFFQGNLILSVPPNSPLTSQLLYYNCSYGKFSSVITQSASQCQTTTTELQANTHTLGVLLQINNNNCKDSNNLTTILAAVLVPTLLFLSCVPAFIAFKIRQEQLTKEITHIKERTLTLTSLG